MRNARAWQRMIRIMLAVSLTGTTFQVVGCLQKVAKNVNPCGTIIDCDPLEWDYMWNGLQPDWNLDPTCTIPGLCGPWPPNSETGGGGGGGGAVIQPVQQTQQQTNPFTQFF